MSEPIASRRDRIREIDRRILELVAERVRNAREIGDLKRARGLPIRNYTVEAEVIRQAREACEAHGVAPGVGEALARILIEEAVRAQEADLRRARRTGEGGRALVVGGGGNMGRWFADFFESKGYDVSISDPRGSVEGYGFERDLSSSATYDVVLVATPPSTVSAVLDALPAATRGLVADISSLKTPCRDALGRARERGLRVTSLHPMWGPRARLLAGKNVVVCSVGVPAADAEARALFEDTAARIVEIPVDLHDGAMAFTLGLPHALNLVFGRVLEGGPGLAGLEGLAGPTFQKQVGVAAEVAAENKDLYREIQALNAHTPAVYAALRKALDDLEKAVGDAEAFRAYMAGCERTFHGGDGTR